MSHRHALSSPAYNDIGLIFEDLRKRSCERHHSK